MKILFYLPVVTPWWFDAIIAPMLRGLHGDAELHVMVAPLWRNCGVEAEQLAPLADLDGIAWHVIDEGDPADFRIDARKVAGLLDLVAEIAPDLTLARSADFATPALFPGTVRYIMEGAAPPFETDPRWVVLDDRPFRHGLMPDSATGLAEQCADVLEDAWRNVAAHVADAADDWRERFGLPAGRPVVAVPLQYEHEENFFLAHAAHPSGIDLVRHLLGRFDEEVVLAITDHPLNKRHLDRSGLAAFVAEQGERAWLCTAEDTVLGATTLLAAGADAMVIDQSKTWSLAAFCGTPMLRAGTGPIAEWLHAPPLGAMPTTGARGLRRPDSAAARRWFGWHLGTRIIDPATLNLDLLVAQVAGQPDPAMVAANLDRVHLAQWELI